jgi:hypothetical protein
VEVSCEYGDEPSGYGPTELVTYCSVSQPEIWRIDSILLSFMLN